MRTGECDAIGAIGRNAAAGVRQGDTAARKAFSFCTVAVSGADIGVLSEICSPDRPPMRLQGLSFRELFTLLSSSLGGVARSQPGERVALPAPSRWSSV